MSSGLPNFATRDAQKAASGEFFFRIFAVRALQSKQPAMAVKKSKLAVWSILAFSLSWVVHAENTPSKDFCYQFADEWMHFAVTEWTSEAQDKYDEFRSLDAAKQGKIRDFLLDAFFKEGAFAKYELRNKVAYRVLNRFSPEEIAPAHPRLRKAIGGPETDRVVYLLQDLPTAEMLPLLKAKLEDLTVSDRSKKEIANRMALLETLSKKDPLELVLTYYGGNGDARDPFFKTDFRNLVARDPKFKDIVRQQIKKNYPSMPERMAWLTEQLNDPSFIPHLLDVLVTPTVYLTNDNADRFLKAAIKLGAKRSDFGRILPQVKEQIAKETSEPRAELKAKLLGLGADQETLEMILESLERKKYEIKPELAVVAYKNYQGKKFESIPRLLEAVKVPGDTRKVNRYAFKAIEEARDSLSSSELELVDTTLEEKLVFPGQDRDPCRFTCDLVRRFGEWAHPKRHNLSELKKDPSISTFGDLRIDWGKDRITSEQAAVRSLGLLFLVKAEPYCAEAGPLLSRWQSQFDNPISTLDPEAENRKKVAEMLKNNDPAFAKLTPAERDAVRQFAETNNGQNLAALKIKDLEEKEKSLDLSDVNASAEALARAQTFLKLAPTQPMKAAFSYALYARIYNAMAIEEALKSGILKGKAVESELKRLREDISKELDLFEKRYYSVGGSYFNSYAFSVVALASPNISGPILDRLKEVLAYYGPTHIPYFPLIGNDPRPKSERLKDPIENTVRETSASSAGRNPTFVLALREHETDPLKKELLDLDFLQAAQNAHKYSRRLRQHLLRASEGGWHWGKEGIAPYFWFPNLPYLFAGLRRLIEDPTVTPEKQAEALRLERLLRKDLFSVVDRDGKFIHSEDLGGEKGAPETHVIPLVGLSALAMCRWQDQPASFGILGPTLTYHPTKGGKPHAAKPEAEGLAHHLTQRPLWN